MIRKGPSKSVPGVGAPVTNNTAYKWIATMLGGLVIGLLGALIGNNLAMKQVRGLQENIDSSVSLIQEHEDVEGHPVLRNRVSTVEEDIREIKDDVDEILRLLRTR